MKNTKKKIWQSIALGLALTIGMYAYSPAAEAAGVRRSVPTR